MKFLVMGTLNSTFNDNVAFAKQAAGVRQQAAGVGLAILDLFSVVPSSNPQPRL